MTNALAQNIDISKNSAIANLIQTQNTSSVSLSSFDLKDVSGTKFSNVMNNIANAKTQKTQSNFVDKAVKSNNDTTNKNTSTQEKSNTNNNLSKTKDANENNKVQKNNTQNNQQVNDSNSNKTAKTKTETKTNTKEENNISKQSETNTVNNKNAKNKTKNLTEEKEVLQNETVSDETDTTNNQDYSSFVESSPVFSSEEIDLLSDKIDFSILNEKVSDLFELMPNNDITQKPVISDKNEEINVEQIDEKINTVVENISNLDDKKDFTQENKDAILKTLNEAKEIISNTNIQSEENIDFKQLLDTQNLTEISDKISDTVNKIPNTTENNEVKEELTNLNNEIKDLISKISQTQNNEKIKEVVDLLKSLNQDTQNNQTNEETVNLLSEISSKIDDILKTNKQLEQKPLQETNQKTLQDLSTVKTEINEDILSELNGKIKINQTEEIKQVNIPEKISGEDISDNIASNEQTKEDVINLSNKNKSQKVEFTIKDEIKPLDNAKVQKLADIQGEINKILKQNQNQETNDKIEITIKDEPKEIKTLDLNNDSDNDEPVFQNKNTTTEIKIAKDSSNIKVSEPVKPQNEEITDETQVDPQEKPVINIKEPKALSVVDEVAKFAMEETGSFTPETPSGNVVYDSASGNGVLISKISNIKGFENMKPLTSAQTQFSKVLEESDVLNQISNKISDLNNAVTKKLTMVLRPHDLGRLSIELSTNKDGLTTNIIAHNEEVRGFIEKNINSLRKQLTDAGVNVNNIQIKTAGSNTSTKYDGEQSQNQNQQQQQENNKQQNNTNQNQNRQNHQRQKEYEMLASNFDLDFGFKKDFSNVLSKTLSYSVD